jgi:hypothetical protein
MLAVSPERAEAECLWAKPNRDAIKYLPPCRVQANHGAEWFTPERIADLERRFPGPRARWRKRLAKLRGETGMADELSPIAPVEERAVEPAIETPAPPLPPMPEPFIERMKAEAALKRIEMLEAHNATRHFNAKHGWNVPKAR